MAVIDIPVSKLVRGKKPATMQGVYWNSKGSTIYVSKRPGPRRGSLSVRQRAWVENFKQIACWSKQPDQYAFKQARDLAKGTGWYYRDVIESALVGKLIIPIGETKITTPTVHVHRSTAESLTAGVAKTLTPNVMDWDNNVFWSDTVNPSRLTCRAPGLYLVGANLFFPVSANQRRGGWLFVNGSIEIANQLEQGGNADIGRINVTGLYYFHAGDYVQCNATASGSGQTVQLHDFWALAMTPEQLLP